MNIEVNHDSLTEDQVRRYFEAHLTLRSDQIRRTHMRNEGGSPLAETPAYKVISSRLYNTMKILQCRYHAWCIA